MVTVVVVAAAEEYSPLIYSTMTPWWLKRWCATNSHSHDFHGMDVDHMPPGW